MGTVCISQVEEKLAISKQEASVTWSRALTVLSTSSIVGLVEATSCSFIGRIELLLTQTDRISKYSLLPERFLFCSNYQKKEAHAL